MKESKYQDRRDKPHLVRGRFTGRWMVWNASQFTIADKRLVAALEVTARWNGEPCGHYWEYIGGGHKGSVYKCIFCGKKDGL